MRATLVVAHLGSLYVLGGDRAPRRCAGTSPGRELLEALAPLDPTSVVRVCGAALASAVAASWGGPVAAANRADWHEALRALPPADPAEQRAYCLGRARSDLEAALRAPEEILVSLAREEERFARSVGREARAAETFTPVPGTPLAEHARAWSRAREGWTAHHRELLERLNTEARRTVPNLSALLGPRTAARLAAAAGGVAPLARMSSSRLQLLGARRRPGPERGPRYGLLYLADGVDKVPEDRRGAFARSLAALAVVAARADGLTRANVAARLVARRDVRAAQLRRRGR